MRQLQLPCAFVEVALRYLLLVLPAASSELACWRARATAIPSPSLRHHALRALAKRGNIEGAALFATLAPRAQRRTAVRALVAFQTAYNYLDALSELPSDDPVANARSAASGAAHRPAPRRRARRLLRAQPRARRRRVPRRRRRGVQGRARRACRPSARVSPRPPARRLRGSSTSRRSTCQTSQGGHGALRRWALETTPRGVGLAWWETAAAAGTSLAVHALIAAAAQPGVDPLRRARDRARVLPLASQRFTPCSTASSTAARTTMPAGAACSTTTNRRSPRSRRSPNSPGAQPMHASASSSRTRTRVILTAMCSYYLSAPECDTDEAPSDHPRAHAMCSGAR